MTRNATFRRRGLETFDRRLDDRAGQDLDEWVARTRAERAARPARPDSQVDPARESESRDQTSLNTRRSLAAEGASPSARPLGRATDTQPSQRPERDQAAALVSDAMGDIGRRLAEMERRFDREGAASIDDARSAIRRIQDRLGSDLTRSDAPPPARPTAIHAASRQPSPLHDFDSRIAALGTRIGSSQPRGGARREGEIRQAVDEIRSRQGSRPAPARPEVEDAVPRQEPSRGTSRAPVTPAEPEAQAPAAHEGILRGLREDLARLSGQLGGIGPAAARDAESLRGEIESLRHSLDGVVTRDDLGRLERNFAVLTDEISDLRASGRSPAAAAGEIEALHAEIRALASAPKACESEGLHQRIDGLAHRLDAIAARGLAPDVTANLVRQLDDIRDVLDDTVTPRAITALGAQVVEMKRELVELAHRQIDTDAFESLRHAVEDMRSTLADRRRHELDEPRALTNVGGQLSDLRRELEEIGHRQIDHREFVSLRSAVEDVRTSLASVRSASERRDASRLDGEPIAAMLSALVDKLDRVERKVADPEALDQLERQIEALAGRVAGSAGRDPALAALERSMGEVLREMATWREGVADVADHAARAAVAETLGTLPRAGEVSTHLDELRSHFERGEARTERSLQGVHRALEDVLGRIASLEGGVADIRRPAPPPARDPSPSLPPTREPAPPRREDPPARRRSEPSFDAVAADADRPLPPAIEEFLLEPGSGRPNVQATRPAPQAGGQDAADIKSSFIAAARRAAQAAAMETAREERPTPAAAVATGAGGPLALARRLRAMLEARRRPLLIGAAALVLALGALQLGRSFVGGPAQPVVATAKVETAPKPLPAPAPVAEALPQLAALQPAPAKKEGAEPAAAPRAIAAPEAPRAEAEPAPVQPESPAPAKAAALPPGPAQPAAEAAALPAGLKAAAGAGNPGALYELASRTSEGRGVPRDAKAATALFEKAAEKGLAPAQYRLGNAYEKGIGVNRDLVAARTWYRRAAENGNTRAMHNLAVLIAEGDGKPDYPAAASWFQKAADHGVRDSQFNLAVLYARGLGVSQDLGRAYLWLAVAALGGDEDAGRKRDEVAGRLQPGDLAKAKAAVEKWRALPGNPGANEVQPPPGGWPEPPVKRASR